MTKSLTIAMILASACSKKADTDIDVAAVNALVPDNIRYKLAFEARDVVIEGKHPLTYRMAVPKDWQRPGLRSLAHLVPTKKDILGETTYIDLSPSCEDNCAFDDWAKVIDGKVKTDFLTILDDRKGDHRRTIISKGGLVNPEQTNVTVMWWKDGASAYHTCYASLEPAAKPALDAFVKACESVVVTTD